MSEHPLIFCAIDTNDLDQACDWARRIGPVTGGLKLGLEFFSQFGPQGVERIRESCPEAQLFLDMKFYDIPNTVAGAVKSISSNLAPAYLNVHGSGGLRMMAAAKDVCAAQTKLLAVTVLTSFAEDELAQVGYDGGSESLVDRMAALAEDAGLDGVVCSAHEIALLRQSCTEGFVLMVPGIRPAGSDQGDQRRVMGPREALEEGATHLVIGRPITAAADPAAAAQAILDEVSSL